MASTLSEANNISWIHEALNGKSFHKLHVSEIERCLFTHEYSFGKFYFIKKLLKRERLG